MMKKITILIILAIFFQNGFTQLKRINIEYDDVKLEKRIWKDFYYKKAIEKHSPLISIRQTVYKVINHAGDIKYTVYDNISLSSRSFDLEKKAYMLIDNQVFPLNIIFYKNTNRLDIMEDTESIMTADSTNMSVVTGYTQNYWKLVKVSYELNREMIEKIQKADKIRLRYYAGPRMITVKLSNNDLEKLKRIIYLN